MVRRRRDQARGLSESEIQDENVDVAFMVWLTSRATADLLDKSLAPSGLTSDEFAIYSVLTSAPGVTPTELSRWMAAPLTTVSSYVKRFESRGHVEREPHPDDRRSYRIKLTPAGRRAHRDAAALFTPLKEQIVEALGVREPEVRDSLSTLRAILDEIRHPPTDDAGTAQA
jgi:DNA-binding MarR family transcriptional regulator